MAKISSQKPDSEDEEFPAEEEAEMSAVEGDDEGKGRTRRILIIALVGVVLIGGAYLANQLFLAPPPPPPAPPVRPAAPSPQAKAPAPPATTPVPAPVPPGAPAKPATKEAIPPAPPAKAPAKTEAKAAPVAPTPAAKTAPEKASRPEKAPPKPAPEAIAGYSLQVGAMVMEENAENLKRRLDQSGFPAVIRKGTAFVTKHVVTVGESGGRREAEDLSRRLNVDGFPSQLLTVDGKYTPQIGAFFNLDEAIDLARELQKKNYQPKITSKPANTVVYQVRCGNFDSRSGALKRGEELKAKGFNFLVVRN